MNTRLSTHYLKSDAKPGTPDHRNLKKMEDSPLSDEILSITSIYGDTCLTQESPTSSTYILRLPYLHEVGLRIQFPPDYPDSPPSVLGTQTVGSEKAGEGKKILDSVRGVLKDVFRTGEPCLYDLIEECRGLLQGKDKDEGNGKGVKELDTGNGNGNLEIHEYNNLTTSPDDGSTTPHIPNWTLSTPHTSKSSTFLARATTITSLPLARSFLAHLLATDKKAAKATHNITAWRIRGPNGTSMQDCDDDGETAAGGRVLRLMQVMDVWDVMAVVSRWYGGVKLGPERFRIIGNVTRDVLSRWQGEMGGHYEGAGRGEGGEDRVRKRGR